MIGGNAVEDELEGPRALFRFFLVSGKNDLVGSQSQRVLALVFGAKHVMLGEDRLRYDPNHYLISTVGLPTISQIDVASPKEPYLGLRLVLDPAVVTSTMVESGFTQQQQEARRLMLTESLDAAEAGFQVGYDDASHFSREYKRHFRDPPVRDIQHLRELTLSTEPA